MGLPQTYVALEIFIYLASNANVPNKDVYSKYTKKEGTATEKRALETFQETNASPTTPLILPFINTSKADLHLRANCALLTKLR